MAIQSVRLNMDIQPAKLELDVQRRVFNLRTTSAKLTMDSEPAVVQITSRPYGTLEIDQSPCRASLGITDFDTLARDGAERGRQAVLDYMAVRAEQGDRMAAIKEDAIPNIAAESTTQPMPSITWGPKESPIIRYTANPVKFDPRPGKLTISAERGTIDLDYQAGKVSGRMVQYPSIRFWTTGNNVDIAK